jgi:hypothetical protein
MTATGHCMYCLVLYFDGRSINFAYYFLLHKIFRVYLLVQIIVVGNLM